MKIKIYMSNKFIIIVIALNQVQLAIKLILLLQNLVGVVNYIT